MLLKSPLINRLTLVEQHFNHLLRIMLQLVKRLRLTMSAWEPWHVAHVKVSVRTFFNYRFSYSPFSEFLSVILPASRPLLDKRSVHFLLPAPSSDVAAL